jgi:hypothetical protein
MQLTQRLRKCFTGWYWGEITNKYRGSEDSSSFLYDVHFPDGDHVMGIRSKWFHRYREIVECIEEGWLPEDARPPRDIVERQVAPTLISDDELEYKRW